MQIAAAACFKSLFLFPLRLFCWLIWPCWRSKDGGACRLLRQLADIELRLAAQDNSKRNDMSEVNKRNVKANMKAVTAKVTSGQLALQQSSA